MCKEEKKAIETVKTITYEMGSIRESVEGHEEDLCALEKILNLIEKQQKEIEELKFKYQARTDRTKVIIEDKQKEIKEAHHKGFIDGRISMKYEFQDKIRATIEDLEKHRIMSSDDFTIKVLKDLLGE